MKIIGHFILFSFLPNGSCSFNYSNSRRTMKYDITEFKTCKSNVFTAKLVWNKFFLNNFTFFKVSRLHGMFPKQLTLTDCCALIKMIGRAIWIFIGNKYQSYWFIAPLIVSNSELILPCSSHVMNSDVDVEPKAKPTKSNSWLIPCD